MNWGMKGWGRRLWAVLLVAAVVAFFGKGVSEASEALPAPQGEVILTVSGLIGRGNGKDAAGRPQASFDRAMLEAIGTTEIVTMTPWFPDVMRFEGVLLRDLLDKVAAQGSSLHAVAHNDYAADIPVEDARRFDVILAMKANGRTLTLRDKGPLFIVYPFSSDKALRSDVMYYRSVWQLRSLEVR
ncbi:molybdopterin-dependent oxidoreductase [uncultured Ferrovibrio sp.]|jgi:hypothetical protein|uniref:molybdopterin-dependent oxidoreductase n=1 Tax=uncultured Ferrovibrio sp. TaxID=1576913 RepID=UPI0026312FB0|nr:molybdopterin-dependent oxidoreductase [uncultured Ferrovibrio sp.]